MKLSLQDELLLVTAYIEYHGQTVRGDRVLLDTGSSGTLFAIDRMLATGLKVEPDDEIQGILGMGFLQASEAVVDLVALEFDRSRRSV